MNLRNLITGIREASIGIIGETLNFMTYGLMEDERRTYAEANMLPKSYILQGIGKIFNNQDKINKGIELEKKARNYSKQRSELFKSFRRNN